MFTTAHAHKCTTLPSTRLAFEDGTMNAVNKVGGGAENNAKKMKNYVIFPSTNWLFLVRFTGTMKSTFEKKKMKKKDKHQHVCMFLWKFFFFTIFGSTV